VAEHLGQPAPAVVEQLVIGRGAGHADRLEDAAASGEDLQVRVAALAQLDLRVARAAKEQMRVRVDQPGRDGSPLRVNALDRALGHAKPGEARLDLGERPGGDDAALVGRHCRRVLRPAALRHQQADVCLSGASAQPTGERGHLRCVVDQQTGSVGRHLPSAAASRSSNAIDGSKSRTFIQAAA
jgi:hypothetical protein